MSAIIKPKKSPIIVFCAASGTGKTTLEMMLCERLGFARSVSATTREPRTHPKTLVREVDGVDYHFLSEEEFLRRAANNEFIEYARPHGTHLYGTLVSEVSGAIASGSRLILNINVDGFRLVKNHPDKNISGSVKGIFLEPPSMEALGERLRFRGDTSEEEIRRRLIVAQKEIACAAEFDYRVVAHEKERTFNEIKTIVEAIEGNS